MSSFFFFTQLPITIKLILLLLLPITLVAAIPTCTSPPTITSLPTPIKPTPLYFVNTYSDTDFDAYGFFNKACDSPYVQVPYPANPYNSTMELSGDIYLAYDTVTSSCIPMNKLQVPSLNRNATYARIPANHPLILVLHCYDTSTPSNPGGVALGKSAYCPLPTTEFLGAPLSIPLQQAVLPSNGYEFAGDSGYWYDAEAVYYYMTIPKTGTYRLNALLGTSSIYSNRNHIRVFEYQDYFYSCKEILPGTLSYPITGLIVSDVYSFTAGQQIAISIVTQSSLATGNITFAMSDMCLETSVAFNTSSMFGSSPVGKWSGLSTIGLPNHVDCGDGNKNFNVNLTISTHITHEQINAYGIGSDWVALWKAPSTSTFSTASYYHFSLVDYNFNATIRIIPRSPTNDPLPSCTSSIQCDTTIPTKTSVWYLANPGQEVFIVVDGRNSEKDVGIFSLEITSTSVLPSIFCWVDAAKTPLCINEIYGYPAAVIGIVLGLFIGFFVPKGPMFATWFMVVATISLCLLALPFTVVSPSSASVLDDSLRVYQPSVQPYAILVFTTGLVIGVAIGWFISTWFTSLMAYDLETGTVVKKYTWKLERSKTVIISWRWDIKSAEGWEKESRILQLCIRRAKALGFKYMLVDVVTLDQSAVDAAAVLYFVGAYRKFPVLVGVDSEQERNAYSNRFWCQYEIFQYNKNKHVFTLEDNGKRLQPTTDTRFELLKSSSVKATYNLDRVRVFILSLPFGSILGFSSLKVIRDAAKNKLDVPVQVAAYVIERGSRYLAGEMQAPLFNMATQHGILGYLLLPIWFLVMILNIPPIEESSVQSIRAECCCCCGYDSDDDESGKYSSKARDLQETQDFFEQAARMEHQGPCMKIFGFWCSSAYSFLFIIPMTMGAFISIGTIYGPTSPPFLAMISILCALALIFKMARIVYQFAGLKLLLLNGFENIDLRGGAIVIGVGE
jgi:hypothetical protein